MAHKPIETMYAGCRFRSRLEARWAVFFDTAGIPWEYEPEGFDIDGTWYLPDFRLPECGTWVEVKGIVRERDLELLPKAAKSLPYTGSRYGTPLIVVGTIPQLEPCWLHPSQPAQLGWSAPEIVGTADMYEDYCITYGFKADGRLVVTDQQGIWKERGSEPWISETVPMEPLIAAAYEKARAARFEHGQKG